MENSLLVLGQQALHAGGAEAGGKLKVVGGGLA
jgi:hypothetical protein